MAIREPHRNNCHSVKHCLRKPKSEMPENVETVIIVFDRQSSKRNRDNERLTCDSSSRIKSKHVLNKINSSRLQVWILLSQRFSWIPWQLPNVASCIITTQKSKVMVLGRTYQLPAWHARVLKTKNRVVQAQVSESKEQCVECPDRSDKWQP